MDTYSPVVKSLRKYTPSEHGINLFILCAQLLFSLRVYFYLEV